MTPEQMQGMAANMSPEMMKQAQDMMRNMSPEQLQNMQRMAESMGMAPPGGPPLSAQSSARDKYLYDAALALKGEGNSLHSGGQHGEAIKKYEHAQSNIEGQTSAQATELRKACSLNIAMCHLKLENFQECAKECTKVLNAGGQDLKALYRRGQAYLGLKNWKAAKTDLEQAVKLAANDPKQRPLIESKLAEAVKHYKDSGDIHEYRDGDVIIEDVTDQVEDASTSQPSSASRPSDAAAPWSAPGMPDFAEAQRMAAQMARDNPEQMHKIAEHMENLSDEEFDRIRRASGMPNMDKDMAKKAASMLKGMSPEQIQRMTEMAATMGPQASAASSQGSSNAASMPAMSPENMASMANMLRDMPPEQMKAFADASGMDISPEMMKMAADAMKSMKPEDVAQMQKMATEMGSRGQGAGSTGGSNPTPDVFAMMRDPEAMDNMMKMMKNMDEDAFVNMLKMAQPGMSEEAARQAARSMKGLDERSMKWLMRGAGAMHGAAQAALNLRAWVVARPGVILALVLLIIAVLLRYFDIV